MSKVRLVAYRKATVLSTLDSTYELDLQEAPNVSLNFQFADIAEPDKRKANYSQTFKLPFTKNNNEFFQDWYNVNLETLVFDARKKFNAVLYVGTIPQFEGVIELRSVYHKAQVYEVVLMSAAADLFTNIGNKKLRDVFRADNGLSYSYDLNHTFNADNVEKSWDGSANDFYAVNPDGSQGASLRDTDADVQKVMYPISATMGKFFYNLQESKYLRLSQSTINAFGVLNASGQPTGLDDPVDDMVWITQLRPAIQIRELFRLILAKAGFSYTSTFIDDIAYFRKLFMTTCNHTDQPSAVVVQTPGQATGSMIVGNSSQWGFQFWGSSTTMSSMNAIVIPANTNTPYSSDYSVPLDPNGLWNTSDDYFTKTDPNQFAIGVKFRSCLNNIDTSGLGLPYMITAHGVSIDSSGDTTVSGPIAVLTGQFQYTNSYGFHTVDQTMDISNVSVGTNIQLRITVFSFEVFRDSPGSASITLGCCKSFYGNNCNGSGINLVEYGYNNMYNEISVAWQGYASNVYDQVVDIPSCIDDSITQKDFLKDILQRFNLVILPDPNDQTNLLIETFNTFISAGEIKHWTDKLDLDKEIIVKDTTSIQKKNIHFTDLEDIDLMNKSVKELAPAYNVYGNYKETNPNEWASGELKNKSIFSPYINNMVYQSANTELGTQVPNMVVQYEYTYKQTPEGFENVLETTKPKLFFYSGSPTNVSFPSTDSYWYMHYMMMDEPWDPITIGGYADKFKAKAFTTYPLCSPFNVTAAGSGSASINAQTKSLYWNANPPIFADMQLFNSSGSSITIERSLYQEYWRRYLNNIYNADARIMECHLNLNEVDIAQFNFNDEIFIKDTYWRVLELKNYQVGAKVSTKAKLLKIVDGFDTTCNGCGQVPASTTYGANTAGPYMLWCPEDNPDCAPTASAAYLLTSEECCTCNGGLWMLNTFDNTDGYAVCVGNAGSMPVRMASTYNPRSIVQTGKAKGLLSGKIAGGKLPLTTGSYTNKFTSPLLKPIADDIVIKYEGNMGLSARPSLTGESHRMILVGYTQGNTRGYAYPKGSVASEKIIIPLGTNMIMKVKGIVTVIGGESSTYTLGTTEGFAYHTAFKRDSATISQIETAGGVNDWRMKEVGANTCSLYIDANSDTGELRFGLDDTQTDTQRIWQLSVDLEVNRIDDILLGYNTPLALYQDFNGIELQNFDQLLWN